MSREVMMTENFFNSLTPHGRFLLAKESQFDYEFALASLEADYVIESYKIGLMKIDHQVFIESGSSELFDSLYTEAEDKVQPKILESIKKMFDKIIKFLRDTIDMIKEKMSKVFGKLTENNLTADQFDASRTRNMMINIDYDKKLKELEAQMTTGQRLIRKASSATGISEEELTGYKNACDKLVSDIPKVACKAAKIGVAAGGFVLLAKNYKTIVNKLCARQESQIKKVEDARAISKGKNPQQEKVVVTAMSSISKKFNEIVSTISLGAMSLTGIGSETEMKKSVANVAATTKNGVSKFDSLTSGIFLKAEKLKESYNDKKSADNEKKVEEISKIQEKYKDKFNKLLWQKRSNRLTEDRYNYYIRHYAEEMEREIKKIK